ncbi:MAG TPA: apolipoprotein N-acyltransferase [Treponemataceae bacterium]|nr:apolipoprotein N-acyltransferase [Treponemataceae bacterium]
MSIPQTLLSVSISAILLSLGIPNEFIKSGSILLGFVSLVPLYLAIRDSRGWGHAGLLGGLQVMLVHIMSSFWLANFKEFAIFTLGASSLAYFGIGILLGWCLRFALKGPVNLRPFLFAAVWMIWEWFKSIGFLAYPWGTVIMTVRNALALIQIADVTGTWGLSFLVSLCSALIAEAFIDARAKTLRVAVGFTVFIFALSLGYGFFRLSEVTEPTTTFDVVVVQQNGDSWDDEGLKKALIVSQRLTRKAIAEAGGKKPDLVVWSESILGWPYKENKAYYRRFPQIDPFGNFMAETGVPLLVGAPVVIDWSQRKLSNSVIMIDSRGEIVDWYAKKQLVPFAEYMPFTEYAWVRKVFDKLVGFSSGWTPGTEIKHMTVMNKEGMPIAFATPICFEDAFSSLIAQLHDTGSDILINLTNDSWSLTDSAEYQHCNIAGFRTVELRTPMIRSTNAGYTVVIDTKGRIVSDLPLFTEGARFVSIPIYPHVTTFYARFGDWLPALAGIVLALYALISTIIDRRRALR